MAEPPRRILVIKLGALGDFVLATGPFAAIRKAHAEDRIVLLTTRAFAELGEMSGYFDEVWVDERPKRSNLSGILNLRRRLRDGGFSRVYDLQTSDRTNLYYRLFPMFSKPDWSGIAAGCSHPHANPNRNHIHTIERQAEQLADAGIADTPLPDLSWATSDVIRFELPEPPHRFILLVPGAAAHRPGKRWPTDHFVELARSLAARDAIPVVVGGPDETDLSRTIAAAGNGLSLAGMTSLPDLAEISRRAAGAVGNDTGPMHIAAICGCPSVVLFSSVSNPDITAPRGTAVTVLQRPDLAALDVSTVADALSLR